MVHACNKSMLLLTLLSLTAAVSIVVNIDEVNSVTLANSQSYNLVISSNPSTGVIWVMQSTGNSCVNLLNGSSGEFIPSINNKYGFPGSQYFTVILQSCPAGASFIAKLVMKSTGDRAGDIRQLSILTPVV